MICQPEEGFTAPGLGAGPCHLAGRSLPASGRSLGWLHLARARGGPVRSRRTLAAGILPSARSWETELRLPGCARFPNAGSIGTGPPLANPYSVHRSPPARAGGTAGRWAFPVPGSPANRSPPPPPNPRSPPIQQRDFIQPARKKGDRHLASLRASPLRKKGHRHLAAVGASPLTRRGPRRATRRPRCGRWRRPCGGRNRRASRQCFARPCSRRAPP